MLGILRKVPGVTVSNRLPPVGIPLVTSDDERIGQLAARHLLDCGFRHFAFCGMAGHRYSIQRGGGFCRTVRAAGYDCAVFGHEPEVADGRWLLSGWLKSLPQPVGIMACNDIRATHLSDECEELGLEVPDHVAIVGVDDDVALCEFAAVPLTSVAPDFEQIGYTAAAVLYDMLQGKPAPRRPILIPPRGITTRRSTEVAAVDDPVVRRALAIIRQHACDPLQVSEILPHVGLSRRPLEIRFRKATGRTIHEEIRRIQFERAKKMLAGSDMKIVDVALAVGFADPPRFTAEFRRTFGEPPSEYRARHRPT